MNNIIESYNVKKLLILDLDETLIHSVYSPINGKTPDFVIDGGNIFSYKRPHLDEFIKFVKENFNLAVWTSASEDYALAVSEHIFGNVSCLDFLWARKRCTVSFQPYNSFDIYSCSHSQQIYIKNLNKVFKRGYNKKNTLILDDSPEKVQKNYGNWIPIKEYKGVDDNDADLLFLIDYLTVIKDVEDVRIIEKRNWKQGIVNKQIKESIAKKM